MNANICHRQRVPGVRNTLTTTVAIAAIALTISACGSSTSDQKQTPVETKAEGTRPDSPLSLEWTDADFEKVAQRIGYGSNPTSLLARNDAGLVFRPETNRDHIATEFIELAAHDGARSLELVLDVQTPGGNACEASLQDQLFNMLVTVPCRNAGKHQGTAQLSPSVTSVRIYFQSPKREQVHLPARVSLIEHR